MIENDKHARRVARTASLYKDLIMDALEHRARGLTELADQADAQYRAGIADGAVMKQQSESPITNWGWRQQAGAAAEHARRVEAAAEALRVALDGDDES